MIYFSHTLPVIAILTVLSTNGLVQAQVQLTKAIAEQALEVAKLSQFLYGDNTLYSSSTADIFEDGPDAAIVYKDTKNEICYAVFRGTDFTNMEDAYTNIDLFPESITSDTGIACTVHGGYKDAFLDPNYFSSFDTKVQECRNSCQSSPCPLVFGGHSQGGGIASIAAVYYDSLNPITITLGKISALFTRSSTGCAAVDPSQTFHFQNTKLDVGYVSAGPYTYYDFAPRLFWGMDWTGNEYLIGPNQKGVIGYPDGWRPSEDWQSAWAGTAHFVSTYLTSLELLLSRNDYSMNGWANGTPCNEHSECSSDYCNGSWRCKRKKSRGESCWYHESCQSGRCTLSWFRFRCN